MKQFTIRSGLALILGLGLSLMVSGLLNDYVDPAFAGARADIDGQFQGTALNQIPHILTVALPPSPNIAAQNPNLPQSGTLIVDLANYDPGLYDIFLSLGGTLYRICENVSVGVSGSATANCSLANVYIIPPAPASPSSGPVPVANGYSLFSAEAGTTIVSVVSWEQTVNVIPGSDPSIAVDGRTPPETTIWAANETTYLNLLFHPVISGTTYDVKLFDPVGLHLQTITTTHSGLSTDVIDWVVPNVGDGLCGAVDTDDCWINSFVAGTTTPVATTTVKINFPQILLSAPSSGSAYVRGETIYIHLKRHTPFRSYDLQIPSGAATALTTLDTNSVGDTPVPIVWVIPEDCSGVPGFPDGTYKMSSHSTDSLNSGALIVLSADFEVLTPSSPALTVDGGTTWPAGSTINIRVLRHLTETTHYLEFNGARIPTAAVDETFLTDSCGQAIIDYTIPVTQAGGTYPVTSFIMSGAQQATLDLMVQANAPPWKFYLPVIFKQ